MYRVGQHSYATHQDAPAYKQINHHCTCLISVDASTVQNGCLEFASGRHNEGIIGLTEDGIVSEEAAGPMKFVACETEPGDVVLFSSYVPHRSMKNLSEDQVSEKIRSPHLIANPAPSYVL